MLDIGVIALLNYDENKLILDEDINDTFKSIFTKIRIGQNKFRRELLKYIKICPITGIDETRILVASHIKPWALSSNKERLDIYNGFIFSPTIDKLFDQGLITFENDQRLVISPKLSKSNIEIVGIQHGKKYHKLPVNDRINYLKYHRENIFISGD